MVTKTGRITKITSGGNAVLGSEGSKFSGTVQFDGDAKTVPFNDIAGAFALGTQIEATLDNKGMIKAMRRTH